MTNFELQVKLHKEMFILLSKSRYFSTKLRYKNIWPIYILKIFNYFKYNLHFDYYQKAIFYKNLAIRCCKILHILEELDDEKQIDIDMLNDCDSICISHNTLTLMDYSKYDFKNKLFDLCKAKIKSEFDVPDEITGPNIIDLKNVDITQHMKLHLEEIKQNVK